MSISTDILGLRQNQTGSVRTLIALLDWQKEAQNDVHILSRGFAVTEAADRVLMNVAVYAAEALNEPPVNPRTRRTVTSSWRKRFFNPGQLHQRRLFATATS